MRCSAAHLRPALHRGHSSLRTGRYGSVRYVPWLCHLVALPRPMGALTPFESTVHGAHGKPLNIAGRTKHLDIQWGEARGRASFIVILGLESPPCLIGMDIM